MRIACCIWALGGSETEALRQARKIGFDFIDIQPTQQRTLESRLLAQELGLRVSCVGASFGMPAGASLDHADPEKGRAAIDYVARALEMAAAIGAEIVYVIPGAGPGSRGAGTFRERSGGAGRRCGSAWHKTGAGALPGHGAVHRERDA